MPLVLLHDPADTQQPQPVQLLIRLARGQAVAILQKGIFQAGIDDPYHPIDGIRFD